MCASSKDNCVAILQQYNLQLKDVNVLLWKEEIIWHAKGIYSSLTPFRNSDSIFFAKMSCACTMYGNINFNHTIIFIPLMY